MPRMNTILARERAEALGWTHQALADELGLNKTTVTKWLLGTNQIPSRYVIPLADLLGLTADRLLRDEPVPAGHASGAA